MTIPTLVRDGTISNAEFLLRLIRCLENYQEYCRVMKVDRSSAPPIEWLDHFTEFLDLSELERAKDPQKGPK